MASNQPSCFYKKPSFLLGLIITIFFLKGVFLVTLFPMFTGQDESRHYNTIQFLNEPREKNWEIIENGDQREKEQLETYNFSQEIKETIIAADLSAPRRGNFEKFSFTDRYEGKNESQINSHEWKSINYFSPPDIAPDRKLYHIVATQLEKIFNNEGILIRFFLIRILSVIFGSLTILSSYFLIKNVGFSEKYSLLMVGIMAFQPKFSNYLTNINYDSLLILDFVLFALAGVLILKNGFSWKNILFLTLSLLLAFFTKGTGIILLLPFFLLIGFYLYNFPKKQKLTRKNVVILILVLAIFSIIKFDLFSLQTIESLGKYIIKSNSIVPTLKNYWGDLDWTRYKIDDYLINIIVLAEALATFGVVWLLIAKNKPVFLPEKKYLLFLLIIVFSLQFGLRFYDWKIYAEYKEILLGTPGRYFLPNLASHIILLFSGLGMLLRKENYFEIALKFGFILMLFFSFWETFNIILFRFYL